MTLNHEEVDPVVVKSGIVKLIGRCHCTSEYACINLPIGSRCVLAEGHDEECSFEVSEETVLTLQRFPHLDTLWERWLLPLLPEGRKPAAPGRTPAEVLEDALVLLVGMCSAKQRHLIRDAPHELLCQRPNGHDGSCTFYRSEPCDDGFGFLKWVEDTDRRVHVALWWEIRLREGLDRRLLTTQPGGLPLSKLPPSGRRRAEAKLRDFAANYGWSVMPTRVPSGGVSNVRFSTSSKRVGP